MSRSKLEADGASAPAGSQVQVRALPPLHSHARRLDRCNPPPPPPAALIAAALHFGRLVRHAAFGCRPAGITMPWCTHAAAYICTWMQMLKQYVSILWRIPWLATLDYDDVAANRVLLVLPCNSCLLTLCQNCQVKHCWGACDTSTSCHANV